jgi:hypothetical protein
MAHASNVSSDRSNTNTTTVYAIERRRDNASPSFIDGYVPSEAVAKHHMGDDGFGIDGIRSFHAIPATFTGSRFLLLDVEWGHCRSSLAIMPICDEEHGEDDDQDRYEALLVSLAEQSAEETNRDTKAARSGRLIIDPPKHALELPRVLYCHSSDVSFGPTMELATRGDALQVAADRNQETLDSLDGTENSMTLDRLTWWVVVEIGEPLPSLNAGSLDLSGCGLGILEEPAHRPLRLVRPTECEVALHCRPVAEPVGA